MTRDWTCDAAWLKPAGGKLIIWHGGYDQHVTLPSLAYYQTVSNTMAALPCGTRSSRCMFSPASTTAAAVKAARRRPSYADDELRRNRRAVASRSPAGVVTRPLPIHRFSTVARYNQDGSDVNSRSFLPPFTPVNVTDDTDDVWIGGKLCSHGYQASRIANDMQLVCNPPARPASITQP